MGLGGFGTNVETFDDVSLEPIAIDHIHHEIHDGNRFIATDFINISAPRFYGITTGTKPCHIVPKVNADNSCIMSLLEGSTFGALGTPMPFINRNRASLLTCGASATKGATVTVDGTPLIQVVIGGPRIFGSMRNEDEFMLKPSTQYFIKLDTSITVGPVNVSINLDVYEE